MPEEKKKKAMASEKAILAKNKDLAKDLIKRDRFKNIIRKEVRNQKGKESRNNLLYYIHKGFRVIYIDEMMVTKSTIGKFDYSNQRV